MLNHERDNRDLMFVHISVHLIFNFLNSWLMVFGSMLQMVYFLFSYRVLLLLVTDL